MPTELEQQLARFAEVLDRDAPTIAFDDLIGRGTVAVDVDLLERSSSDRASRVNGVPWSDTTPSHDESGERDVLIELAPAVAARRPAWRRVAVKVALGVAAAAVLVITLAAIERGGDEPNPVVDFPDLTTTFVSPRNGFSVGYVDRGEVTITPATDSLERGNPFNSFDVLDPGSSAVFGGTSTMLPEGGGLCSYDAGESIPCPSIEEQIEQKLLNLPGACGVPRSQQKAITIDGHSGRVVECTNHIEASLTAGDRLYIFTLSHERDDGRAVFDAFVATIDLTPEMAVDFPNLTDTFVSPTYGYSFGSRREPTPATERWDPSNQPVDDIYDDHRLDTVETGYGAVLEGASTPVPNGVSIDGWVDQYVTPLAAGGCGQPRDEQEAITIDGQPGRIAECQDQIDATVVAGGRLYLFTLHRSSHDARAMFDAWNATIDLTPETAAVP